MTSLSSSSSNTLDLDNPASGDTLLSDILCHHSVSVSVSVSSTNTTLPSLTSTTFQPSSSLSATTIVDPLDQVVEYIRNAKRILVIVGAGISTRSGIPDFRSPSTGLYDRIRRSSNPLLQRISEPQEIFDIRLFYEEPELFYSVCPLIFQHWRQVQPSLTHHFLAALGKSTIASSSSSSSRLLRLYTQNVDGLEYDTTLGLTKEQIIQCHGTLKTASCVQCNERVPIETLFPLMQKGQVPYCTNSKCANHRRKKTIQCSPATTTGITVSTIATSRKRTNSSSYSTGTKQGIMKPDVIFFHEPLPSDYEASINSDILSCDLVLVIGTSLAVKPVSLIPSLVPHNIPKIFINKECSNGRNNDSPTNHSAFTMELIGDADTIVYLLWKRCASIIPSYTGPLPTDSTSSTLNDTNNSSSSSLSTTIIPLSSNRYAVPFTYTFSSTNTTNEGTVLSSLSECEWNNENTGVTSSSFPTVKTTRSGRNVKVMKYTE